MTGVVRAAARGLAALVSLAALSSLAGCSDDREALRDRRPLASGSPYAEQLVADVAQVGPVGRFERLRPPRQDEAEPFDAGRPNEANGATREQIAALRAIGYVGGSRDNEFSGVRIRRPDAQPGLNLYSSGSAAEAFLMTLDGQEIHRWHADFWQIWPDYPISRGVATSQWWRRVALLEDGALLAIFEGLGLVKLDAESRVVWARPISAHHDLDVLPGGDIYVLTRDIALVSRRGRDVAIFEDFVERLDPQGRSVDRFSLLRAFEDSPFADVLDRVDVLAEPDIFHTNTLHVIRHPARSGEPDDRDDRDDRDEPDDRDDPGDPVFRPGNLLVSLRSLDVIAVVDPRSQRVVWAHQGSFRGQHDPKVLANGNLLLFDNEGPGDRSVVLEIAPDSLETQWSYGGTESQPLYSMFCGTAERLANGNTLITETDNGRAFEVTPAGERVWEFYNPRRAGPNGEFIASIAELIRLPLDADVSWTRPGG